MKRSLLLLISLIFALQVYSQFEQKVSMNLSFGGFKTFGDKLAKPDAYQARDPAQMPNYRAGISASAGIQYNLNRHISFLADVSIMYSPGWIYKAGDYNYLHYQITDTLTGDPLAIGENKLKLFNFSIGITPKYYIFAVRKWNPYLFAGISLNFTSAKYTDNAYADGKRLNLIKPGDTEYNPYLEKNIGLGFLPGIGLERNPSDKFSIYIECGYSLILLKAKNFKNPLAVENLNAVIFRTGIRFSFLKSKNL